MQGQTRLERGFERVLFGARWLMAPVYLGLAMALVLLLVVFFRELLTYLPQMLTISTDKAILAVLTLIDLVLAGNLLLIVLFSGYESFVSKLDVATGDDGLSWMGTVDFSGLKLKLIASIVAISAIHLLKKFMEIGKDASEIPIEDLKWMVIVHITFVTSGVIMAAMDWLTAKAKSGKTG